ncbi:MAG: MarR family transcriptional regulator [Candidatus Faecousia sp.]|nr:MarR family transcriptional regulator [Candidatus Faecousia sp.]
MIERFEKFSLAIAEISRYWHKIAAEELGKYSLKASHANYLLTLYRYPEGLTAPKLAELCDRDKADVSRMLSILESKGLVTKVGTNSNRYRGNLYLTPEGKTVAKELTQRAELAVEQAGKGLTEENRKIFYESLEMITNNLRKISEEGL